MAAWELDQPRKAADRPLQRVERLVPTPGRGEVRLRVAACGVCRTDLHLAEGDLPAHGAHVVPGHEVVGYIDELGDDVVGLSAGDRLGIPWLRQTDGTCAYCERGAENLCPASLYTGWDADGGYAEYAIVRADYAYLMPLGYRDAEAAPLLCAGIVGYRALKRSSPPEGGRVGIFGFGASAHLAAQVAIAGGHRVHVLTRSPEAQQLALDLGAASAGPPQTGPPEKLDSAVLFAPAGSLVPTALEALDRGGTLSIAGIHLSEIPPLDYAAHLFQERTIRTTTANTREDGREFLTIASRLRLQVSVTPYALGRADEALIDLAEGRVTGAAVLVPGA